MVSIFKKNMLANLSLIFFTVLLSIYRFNWIELAYWGEDPSTNLWLGYVKPISELNIDYHRHSDDSYMKTTLNQYLKQRLLKKSKKRVHRKSHGKISFKDLASLVANRWKTISPEKLSYYKKLAELDKINYDLALSKCKRQRLIKGKRI